jgi:large subunit ribosomal protein L23
MNIITHPVVTEKMNAASDKQNCYGFIVDPKANKIMIKDAVEKAYGVTVEAVKTMNYYGKKKTRFTKTGVTTGNKVKRKKALVYLKDGDKIDFFSNI